MKKRKGYFQGIKKGRQIQRDNDMKDLHAVWLAGYHQAQKETAFNRARNKRRNER